jgi:hypothetical protein
MTSLFERGLAALGLADEIVLGSQARAQEAAYRRLVVDDENAQGR